MTSESLRKFGIAATVVLVVGIIVLVNVLSGGGEPETPVDETRCPDCGRELPDQAQVTGECPYCKLAKDSGGSGKKKTKRNWGLHFSPVAIGIIAFPVAAGCLLLFLRYRRNRVYYVDEEFGYFRCPYCKRRLRFALSKAGQKGRCPLCKRHLFFPVADPRLAEF